MIETLTHSKSGASCKIHAFGATVLSFVSADGRENLFVSKDAKLDGSKAVRGGIPLVFPIFGPPDEKSGSTMPQHGFARNNMWEIKPGSKFDHEGVAGISYTLELKNVSNGRGENNLWSTQQAAVDGTDCRLQYDIVLSPKSLTTTLMVENTGSDAFNMHMLQHTYYKVDNQAALDKTQCYVKNLDYYSIVDKIHPELSGKQQMDEVVLAPNEATDKIFLHPAEAAHPTIKVQVGVGGGGKTISMEAAGMIDESPVPVSVVVWNPNAAKAAGMSDFANDEYKDMICVEPGLIGHQPLLGPGKKAQLTQIMTVE